MFAVRFVFLLVYRKSCSGIFGVGLGSLGGVVRFVWFVFGFGGGMGLGGDLGGKLGFSSGIRYWGVKNFCGGSG